MKHRKSLILGLGLIPWGFVACFAAFYYQTWRTLGYLPFSEASDTKEAAIYLSYEPWILLTAEIWSFSFLIWILVLSYVMLSRKRMPKGLVVASAIGQAVAIVLLLSGVTGLFHE